MQASLVAQMVKNLPAIQETHVQSLGQEDPLEKGRATHSSIPAWRIPWTEEPERLQSLGSQRVGHDCVTNAHKVRRNSQHDSFHPDPEVARWKWLRLYVNCVTQARNLALSSPHPPSLTTAAVQWKSYRFHLLNPSWVPHYPQVQAFVISCLDCHCSHWLGPLADRMVYVIQPGESSCWKSIIPCPSPTQGRPHYLAGPRSLSVL